MWVLQMEGLYIPDLGKTALIWAKWHFLGCLTRLFPEIVRYQVTITPGYGYDRSFVF